MIFFQLSVLPDPQCDSLFSFTFLSPQSLPPHPVSDDDLYSYGIDNGLLLTDDYCTISPPAEYAEDNLSERNSANKYGIKTQIKEPKSKYYFISDIPTKDHILIPKP